MRLGVRALIVESDARIGDVWRKRYVCCFVCEPL